MGQAARAAHAGLFIDRQQGLDRAVRDIPAVENGQNQRHTDSVIGPQCGFLSQQPAIIENRNNRIAQEIVSAVTVFLANHIQMRLQHYVRSMFSPRRCRLANKQIACRIDLRRQSSLMRPGQQLGAQGRLMLGSPWNAAEGSEMRPHGSGLKSGKYRGYS
ncbi:hypothetical protein SDC9_163886 [bioreactor metagenome]|uniref:Uncharacterized protein n=1 Tax=bioreactor metagenome TaxID=1076179 RepID=A0A645FQ48_9ZZZZ